MVSDWLSREGDALVSYWLLTLLASAAVFPLFFRVLRALPGRGYALSRAGGLMLVGFVYWLLNNYGLLNNTPGSTIFAWLLVLGLSVVAFFTWRDRDSVRVWLREHWTLMFTVEILFVVMFVGWAAFRALNPEIYTTEKPMEMAFLSAIRRSAQFPPNDPWMSGYAISYYHFGYILLGMLGNMAGISNGLSFGIGLPLIFALGGVTAFGVAYELVASRLVHLKQQRAPALVAGLLAAVFAVVMGNLGVAMVEMPYQTNSTTPQYLAWMNLAERDTIEDKGCPPSGSNDPANWCYWWWFRYSRVVRDLDLSGVPIGNQPIDEFPNFSFILGDLHPHVLALPFALFNIGLGLNLVLGRRRLKPWELLLYAIYAGGMVFLNSWDAVYVGFIIGAEGLRRLVANGTGRFTREDWFGIAGFAAAIIGLTAVLYMPFFIGFRSQAGGVLPNVIWQTQFQQFFLMFGIFLVILGAFVIVESLRAGRTLNIPLASIISLSAGGLALLAFVVLAVVAWSRDDVRAAVYQFFGNPVDFWGIIPEVIARRLHGIFTQGVLIIVLFFIIARLFAREERNHTKPLINYSPTAAYVLLLIAAGGVLSLAPEFVYLRDGFGTRINTLFKFYYQTWLFWSVASAYAVWSIIGEESPERSSAWRVPYAVRGVFTVIVIVLVVCGLLYAPAAVISHGLREGGHINAGPNEAAMTLDGASTLAQGVDDYNVIQCLNNLAVGDKDVVAEATRRGLAYAPSYGRVSGLTGIPTLLGWDNHEGQWRGSTFEDALYKTYVTNTGVTTQESRYDAVATLYNTQNVEDALDVIKRYGITYIYVGPTEQREFDANGLAKFAALTPVCSSGSVAVYPAAALAAVAPAVK